MRIPDPMSQLCMTLGLLVLALCLHIQATADDVDNEYRFMLRVLSTAMIVGSLWFNVIVDNRRNKS